MKTLAIIPYLFLLSSATLFPMEETISKLNRIINTQYNTSMFFSNQRTPLIRTIEQEIAPLENKFLIVTTLYKQNYFFKIALKYFIKNGLDTLKTASFPVLKAIESSDQTNTPYPFNLFNPEVKNFILQKAAKQLSSPYTITLSTNHNTVDDCDICPKSHLAAASYRNLFFRVWCLKTRDCLISTKHHGISMLRFSQDGLLIAVLDKENFITVWSIKTKKPLYVINSTSHPIDNMVTSWNKNYGNIIHTYDYKKCCISSLTLDTTPPNIFSAISPDISLGKSTFFKKDNYAYAPKNIRPIAQELAITKVNPGYFSLCKKVLKNTQIEDIPQIYDLDLYQSLTLYEKKKIATKIYHKKNNIILKNSNPITIPTNFLTNQI